MTFRFGDYELDLAVVELRRNGTTVPIEPQVFRLLAFLIEHRDRMVSKEEIIERVWDGRVVSDSALTSRIKSLRRAVGDDGGRQSVVRTVRGRGFRFVGAVAQATPESLSVVEPASQAAPEPAARAASARPSIAILPFSYFGSDASHALLGDAIPHELITALSRLRWLSVIARGSSFRFRDNVDVLEVGKALNVGYCLTGLIRGTGRRVAVSADLVDTRDRSVLWSEVLEFLVDDVHGARESIVASVISALEIQIPLHEARHALLKTSDSLDAWAEYHLGLQAMYRFNKHDNSAADLHFRRALELDPAFARAHAGLSFTSFQDAFLDYSGQPAAERARHHAERSIELDPIDPFANLIMGRSIYLAGDVDASLGWLDRSIELSPSFAQAQYARGWAHTIAGRAVIGREGLDRAMVLSPLDPLLYAMRASRALSHLVIEEFEAAAPWAEKGASSPGAHVLVALIAVIAHALAGNAERARYWAADVKRRRPDVTGALFFRSFPFADARARQRFGDAMRQYGISER